MIKIEIDTTDVETFEFSTKTGKPFSIRKQRAWAHLHGAKYPTEIEVLLTATQSPYPVGQYVLSPASIYVGRYRSLRIGRLKLQPLSKTQGA